jgi:hypothetical protein
VGALLAAQGALLLTAPSYYRHHGTYLAPALALIVGAAVAVDVRTADGTTAVYVRRVGERRGRDEP